MVRCYFWRVLAIGLAIIMIAPVAAQDEPVTLETFTNNRFGIQGLRPGNWTETAAGSGVFVRRNDTLDRTALVIQSASGTAADLLTRIATQLELDSVPGSSATVASPSLTWSVYRMEYTHAGRLLVIDLALAAEDDMVYLVLLQSQAADSESLHTGLFEPAVEALVPAQVASDSPDDTTPEPAEATPEATAEATPEAAAEATQESGQ